MHQYMLSDEGKPLQI